MALKLLSAQNANLKRLKNRFQVFPQLQAAAQQHHAAHHQAAAAHRVLAEDRQLFRRVRKILESKIDCLKLAK